MAQICIWTPEGWICDSASFKRHVPGARRCRNYSPAAAARESMATARTALSLAGLGRGQRVIERVVRLMLAAGVGETTPFTIIKAR